MQTLIAKIRRHIQEMPMEIYTIRITFWHARMARKIGNGNLCAGVRLSLEFLADYLEKNKTCN